MKFSDLVGTTTASPFFMKDANYSYESDDVVKYWVNKRELSGRVVSYKGAPVSHIRHYIDESYFTIVLRNTQTININLANAVELDIVEQTI